MPLTLHQYVLGGLSGGFVGFSLGLTGGGGSLLALPLMVYFVGISDTHRAIGTTAVAVAANAAINLLSHARIGRVKWSCAGLFATTGVVGAALGSLLGKEINGQKLLFLFAILMVAAALLLLRRRRGVGDSLVTLNHENAPRLAGIGFLTGGLSGFFGIGGGFLIVPGLILATGMPIINAVGTSLVSVAAFSATTAASYAVSHQIIWPIALTFVAGGAVGGFAGATLAEKLSIRRGALNTVFAVLLVMGALHMLYRSGSALGLL